LIEVENYYQKKSMFGDSKIERRKFSGFYNKKKKWGLKCSFESGGIKKIRDVWTYPRNRRHLVAYIRVQVDATGWCKRGRMNFRRTKGTYALAKKRLEEGLWVDIGQWL
jgi:hypothetical protein